MRSAKRDLARKTLACLTGFVLAAGLMPGIALAEDGYQDTDKHVYVGPETQTTMDVGNVTLSDDPDAKYAVYAHAKNEEGATANVHGYAEITGVKASPGASGVVAHANSHKAAVYVDSDVKVDVTVDGDDEYNFMGIKADAMDANTEAAVSVGGNLTVKATRTDESRAGLNVCGIEQGTPDDSQGQRASSNVNIGGDVLVEAGVESGGTNGFVTGISTFAHDHCSTTMTVKGGVTVKGDTAIGISSISSSTDSGVGDDTVIFIGKKGLTVESDAGDGDATGIQANSIGGSITVRISGDVTAKVNDGGEKADSVGITTMGEAGTIEILVDGTVTAKTAGVVTRNAVDQLDITVWKIDSDLVGAKWSEGTKGYVEDEATEAAINYIIKVEQPKEGNILKLAGTLAKEATMVDGDKSFDVASMGKKVYLDVEEGWTITAAFNGLGEKVALEKDGQGWFVIVPNGGGVYLSAQVAKQKPEPEPTPAPNPSYTETGGLPATGDSDMAIIALSLTAFASLALVLFAANRMRLRREL